MKKITISNSEISFIKLSSYEGTQTTGKVDEIIGLSQNVKGRNIIILEDIVDTGNTLRANGLEPMDHIADISSRLVVGQASLKMKHRQIQPILDMLQEAIISRREEVA